MQTATALSQRQARSLDALSAPLLAASMRLAEIKTRFLKYLETAVNAKVTVVGKRYKVMLKSYAFPFGEPLILLHTIGHT